MGTQAFSMVLHRDVAVVLLLACDAANASEATFWPCKPAQEGDADHVVSDYGFFGCGATKKHNRRCAIFGTEQKCVCRHEGTMYHHERRWYVRKGKSCVNQVKWFRSHLTEDEEKLLQTNRSDADYSSPESEKLHEVVATMEESTAIGKFDANQCQKAVLQGVELVTNLGIGTANIFTILALSGSACPLFGIPAIVGICAVSLGLMAWSKHLSASEKKLQLKYQELLTTMKRVMIGLDSVNVVIEKHHALIKKIRGLNDTKVSAFLGSDALKAALDPHNQVLRKNPKKYWEQLAPQYSMAKKVRGLQERPEWCGAQF